jgi:hypothetical protein
MTTVSGQLIRTVRAVRRRLSWQYFLIIDGTDPKDYLGWWGAGAEIVDAVPLLEDPALGPALLTRRVVGDASDRESLLDRFDAEQNNAGAAEERVAIVRDSSVEVWTDDEFWGQIALLGGQINSSSVAKLVRSLSGLTAPRIAGFAYALRKRVAVRLEKSGVGGDADVWSVLEQIALGRNHFTESTGVPSSVDGRGEMLEGVAEQAYARRTQKQLVLIDDDASAAEVLGQESRGRGTSAVDFERTIDAFRARGLGPALVGSRFLAIDKLFVYECIGVQLCEAREPYVEVLSGLADSSSVRHGIVRISSVAIYDTGTPELIDGLTVAKFRAPQ